MVKASFQGLTLIRKQNQFKILSLLKNGSCSCSQLAETLNLSNVAIYNIMNDLAKRKITLSVTGVDNNIGRKPSMYMLNEKFGLFVCVDFSKRAINISIFNIYGKILAQRIMEERELFSLKDIEDAADAIEEMLQDKPFNKLELKCICICTPGRTDKKTGYFIAAARFLDFKNINLYNIFHNRFNCLTIVKNDMFFELTGHKSSNLLSPSNSALYLHIDLSLGAALYINGEIYEGDHGFAGEFGSTIMTNSFPINHELAINFMVTEYNRILLENNPDAKPINEDMFISLFMSGNELADKLVRHSSEVLAYAVNNILIILDVSSVILNGNTRVL